MAENYSYFDLDGIVFRRNDALGGSGVSHIRKGDGWAPYHGDRMKPFAFGDKISEKEATHGMAKIIADAAE